MYDGFHVDVCAVVVDRVDDKTRCAGHAPFACVVNNPCPPQKWKIAELVGREDQSINDLLGGLWVVLCDVIKDRFSVSIFYLASHMASLPIKCVIGRFSMIDF